MSILNLEVVSTRHGTTIEDPLPPWLLVIGSNHKISHGLKLSSKYKVF